MAYIDVYDNDYGKITLDRDTLDKIFDASKKRLTENEQITFSDLLIKLEDIKVDDVEVYLRSVQVSKDDISEAYEDYCDGGDYDQGKEDGYEDGYEEGLKELSERIKDFKNNHWKVISKLEKYAYYNEENTLSKDDVKELLDIFNNI